MSQILLIIFWAICKFWDPLSRVFKGIITDIHFVCHTIWNRLDLCFWDLLLNYIPKRSYSKIEAHILAWIVNQEKFLILFTLATVVIFIILLLFFIYLIFLKKKKTPTK